MGRPQVAAAQAPLIEGGSSADTLRGTASADRIDGGAGADRLSGGVGRDRIEGGSGADRIDGGPGRDTISCGDGRDRVLAERQDRVADDCETATYRRSLTDESLDAPVDGHHGQHSANDGHLPGSSENVELVGQLDIAGAAADRVADVPAHGNYAYLTVRDPEGCSDAGVSTMDISDPTEPVEVGFIDATEGSLPGEGAQVVDLRPPTFRGQVLVFSNEVCAQGADGGVSLWDVTDPQDPKVLTAHAGDSDPGGAVSPLNQTQSAFAWQQGRRAFVVSVDDEESTDVDIFEITDPTKPTPGVPPRHGRPADPGDVDDAAVLLGRRLGAARRRRSGEPRGSSRTATTDSRTRCFPRSVSPRAMPTRPSSARADGSSSARTRTSRPTASRMMP